MATPEETKETMQAEAFDTENKEDVKVDETTKETPVDNDEATLDKIKQELDVQKALLQQTEDQYKRLQADFANFRRRNEKEREELSAVILQGLIKDLLPIIDNFERALAVEGVAGTPLHDGISMVYNQLMESLKKNGLETIKATGEKFDPNFHQAVMRVQDPEKEDDTIEEELQKGYMVQGRVIRPSMVKVVAN